MVSYVRIGYFVHVTKGVARDDGGKGESGATFGGSDILYPCDFPRALSASKFMAWRNSTRLCRAFTSTTLCAARQRLSTTGGRDDDAKQVVRVVFFHPLSNDRASLLLQKPDVTMASAHGCNVFFEVHRAPPQSSPLCCRMRRAMLFVAPTYVFFNVRVEIRQ